jgi:hypothetical protein
MTGGAGAGAGVGGADDTEPTFPALFARALAPGAGGLRPAFGTGGAPPIADGPAFVAPVN